MYATICCHAGGTTPAAERDRTGRALAARLGALPGFVAYLLVEEPDGGCVAVSLFERRADLEDAGRLVTAWLAAHPDVPRADSVAVAAGEVVVQKGL